MSTRTAKMLQFTNHGEARIQQRGISKKMTNLIFSYADRETRRGGDVVGLSLSRAAIGELQLDGLISSGEAESLLKIVLLYSHSSEALVTVLKGSSRRAKAYTRDSRWKYAHNKRSGNNAGTGMTGRCFKVREGGV